ncbi:hypothetical protein JM83_2906 [Gillisia sp. Hel_I_86]|uniref:hypothetical protein n=1 Tax=Gillisia sp. Hel_I_86 TaxID=1249981 RepID=UPI00119B8797|nr:hypothetical protein [Gillisia sp. Hel_I_86]TVZ27841.1 hypothetical protein JM83_2906 [Gillisia sp. Hel_I_86]
MKKSQLISIAIFSLFIVNSFSQEIIDASNPDTFILGGGQETNIAFMDLQRIAITDIEPDPHTGSSSSATPIEAGKPYINVGSPTTDEFWLNFTYRSRNNENAKIFTRSNQPIPEGINVIIQIISTANIGGVYNANPNTNPITLNISNQVIVNDFASGYTGDGENTGYLIRYTIENPSFQSLPTGFEIIFEIR